jgi:hypothetical protein
MVVANRGEPGADGHVDPHDPLRAVDRRWIRFRDGWGAFWGLRILQRVNQTAALSGWPVRLEWVRGFVPASGQSAEEVASATVKPPVDHIEQTLDSLLRRFERLDGR